MTTRALSSAQMGQQLRMFDPASTRAQDPGEMHFDKWLQQPNVAYHGTFHPHWEEAPYHHFGDINAATKRLTNVQRLLVHGGEATRQSYYSGEAPMEDVDDWGDPSETTLHIGRVFARRLDVGGRPFTDLEANTGQVRAMRRANYEPWEIPASVAESAEPVATNMNYEGHERVSPRAKTATRYLERGKGISYDNPTEGGTSYVAPRHSHTAWEHDVVTSKFASPTAKEFAQSRISKGVAGQVPFKREGQTLNEVQFATAPEDETWDRLTQ